MKAGARLDSERRYLLGKPGRSAARRGGHAVPSLLRAGRSRGLADWTGVAKPHAKRLWKQVEAAAEVGVGKRKAWALSADLSDLESPPDASGVRLIPAGDPYLQKPNRPLLAPDAERRKRLFRPVASPGAVLRDGRLVGLWRAKAKGKNAEITVEKLGRIARDLEPRLAGSPSCAAPRGSSSSSTEPYAAKNPWRQLG